MTIQATTQTGVYDIDTAHSTVEFKVRHLGFSRVSGRFTDFSGHFKIKENDLSSIQASVEIRAASVNTGDEKRDEHLRSADFFEVDKYPTLRFDGLEVANVSDDEFRLTGSLTIRDVTRPVEVVGKHLGVATDPWGGSRMAFQGYAKINRKEFGLTWNQMLETGGVLVGESVEIHLDIQGVLRKDD